MPEISIDIDEAVAKEIAKRDRKIQRLEAELAKAKIKAKRLQEELVRIDEVRTAIVNAAYWIEPVFNDD